MNTVISKPAAKSWTLLLNGAAIVVAVLSALTEADIPYLTAAATSVVGVGALAVANFLLRWKTKLPVTAKGGDVVVIEEPK